MRISEPLYWIWIGKFIFLAFLTETILILSFLQGKIADPCSRARQSQPYSRLGKDGAVFSLL